jgi:hypothetical protein
VLLLLTAGCILAGGVVLSKREHTLRIPQDRAPLDRFALDLMRELRRLEDLHVSHIDRLSRWMDTQNSSRTQHDCEAVVGVAECSFLTRGVSKTEHYVRLSGVPYGRYPRPTFETPSIKRADFTVLDPARFFEGAESSAGWIDEPGKPLFYWRCQSETLMVLLTIEPGDVQKAMNGWLQTWLRDHPAPKSSTGAGIELSAPDGTSLLGGDGRRKN